MKLLNQDNIDVRKIEKEREKGKDEADKEKQNGNKNALVPGMGNKDKVKQIMYRFKDEA